MTCPISGLINDSVINYVHVYVLSKFLTMAGRIDKFLEGEILK